MRNPVNDKTYPLVNGWEYARGYPTEYGRPIIKPSGYTYSKPNHPSHWEFKFLRGISFINDDDPALTFNTNDYDDMIMNERRTGFRVTRNKQ